MSTMVLYFVLNLFNTADYFRLVYELVDYPMPVRKAYARALVCADIHKKSIEIKIDPSIPLAVGWLESTYVDKKGKPVTNRSGRTMRAEGPLQVLKYYHCRKNPNCDTTKTGIKLMKSLIKKYGEKKGLAIYAGGYENSKSLRYARMALRLRKKIKKLGY